MNEETTKIIQEQFVKLPNDVQEAIKSFDWLDKVQDLAKKYSLRVDQAGEFQTETMLVLIGLTHPNDYAREVKARLGLDSATVTNLVTDANETIFKKIKDSLMNNFNKVEDEEENLQTSEKQILSSSGVELEGEEVEEYDPPKEKPIDRNKVLSGVENPTPSVSAHLVDDKMSQPFSIPTAKKEYSASNIPTPKPQTPPAPNTGKPVDPYRMPI